MNEEATVRRLTVGTSESRIGFETDGGGDWPVWDRYLTVDGWRTFHLGNICNTCDYFFTRKSTVHRNFSPGELREAFADGLSWLDVEWLKRLGEEVLPLGDYLVSLQTVRPRLVVPRSANDYFRREYSGRGHNPRTEYYGCRSGAVLGLDAGASLFEFIVPLIRPSQLSEDRVQEYRQRRSNLIPPTALVLSVLDIKNPYARRYKEVDEHWCFAHFLLDGHHKVYAAATSWQTVSLLSFLALEQGLSNEDACMQLLSGLSRTDA